MPRRSRDSSTNNMKDGHSYQHQQQLPSWIFDVDEFDDLTDAENLDLIDPEVIRILCSMWRFCLKTLPLAVLTCGCRDTGGLMMKLDLEAKDFGNVWGPLAVVGSFMLVLWAGAVKDATWALFIWTAASTVSHLIGRASLKTSKLVIHMGILGLSILPLVPIALIIVIFDPTNWVRTVLSTLGILWATSVSSLCHRSVYGYYPRPRSSSTSVTESSSAEERGKPLSASAAGRRVENQTLSLLVVPALLQHIYLLSFL